MTSTLAGLNLWSLWSPSTARCTSRLFAAAIPVGYWAPFLVAPLVRGTGVDDPPHPIPRVVGGRPIDWGALERVSEFRLILVLASCRRGQLQGAGPHRADARAGHRLLAGPSLIAMSGWDHLPGLRAAATWQRLAVGSAPECLAECWQLYGEVQGFCAAPP